MGKHFCSFVPRVVSLPMICINEHLVKITLLCSVFAESLIEAIHGDIKEAEEVLDKPENQAFLSHNFFSKTDNDKTTANSDQIQV